MKTLKISDIPFSRKSYEREYKEDVKIIIDEPIPKDKELIIKMITTETKKKMLNIPPSRCFTVDSIGNYNGREFKENEHARIDGQYLIIKYYPEVHIVNKHHYDIKNLVIRTSGRIFENGRKTKDIKIKNTTEQSQNLPSSSRDNGFDWESFNNLFAGINQMQHHTFNCGNMSQTVYTPENANVEVVNIPLETRNFHIGDNYVGSAGEMANLPYTTRQTTKGGNRVRVMQAENLDTLHIGNTYHIDHTSRREQNPSPIHRAQQPTAPQMTETSESFSQYHTSNIGRRSQSFTQLQRTQPATSSQAEANDLPPGYEGVIEHNLGTAVDEHPLYLNNNVHPSYEAVIGGGAAAATGLPPTYSETPREGETRIASNLSDSRTSNPLSNLRGQGNFK